MDIQGFFEQAVGLIGTASPLVALILFLLCLIGEFGFGIPFLLETVWILSGYQASRGQLSLFSLSLLVAGAVAGREAGAIILYFMSRYGSLPLISYYKRRFEKDRAGQTDVPSKIAAGLSHLSFFAVAMGRLMWLRIPLTLALGAQRRGKTLIIAVFMAAIAWDVSYIILGATAGTAIMAKPASLAIYSVAGLAVVYIAVYIVRRIRKYLAARKLAKLT